jgi:NAD(P)-dependent dehydrogenase (short-subunit alcohol dehydrogenase family)
VSDAASADERRPETRDPLGAPPGEGPAVLITGATGTLGRVVARRFAAAGAQLALTGRDQARLDMLGAELASALRSIPGFDAVAAVGAWTKVTGDLRDAQAARDIAAAVEARHGRIDVLVHLVGGWSGGTAVIDLERASIEAMLEQHLWTTVNVVQAVVPGMLARGAGRVLAVSSPVAVTPPGRQAGYAIAKAAEEVVLRSLAREVAGRGLTANLVIVRGIAAATDPEAEPTQRKAGWATPDEIAEALLYLASPGAAAINGVRLELNTSG